ncbi:amidase precursor [Zea mays]|uniref:Amidase domain-containing protein n=2 Tax=Zea mays TaxID=4577 RepID=A0A804QBT5_MAIZE|nr:amidase precursor [Zea mays]
MVDLRLQVVATVLGVALAAAAAGSSSGKQFEFQEATVDAIHQGFRNGSLTSTALARFYLEQIARLNPLLRAVIEVNPDALAQAARADAERAASRGRCAVGLHGIPVLLKDNIDTRDRLNTTAGSLALLGSVVRRDAGVVARLRRAGAVILGKANPSEWSNFRPVASGWSARGGQTLNPYVLSVTPCGSSAGPGVAAAANMAAVTLGSETDGSILCPSSLNSVVGIKPTVGLTSRSGVIPITPLQDTIGPMCRTVSDAVRVLDVIVGYDELDAEATGAASKYIPHGGYTQFLRTNGLRGKRIGVPDVFFQGYDDMQLAVYEKHLDTMRQQGAVVIMDLDIATNFTDLGNQEILLMAAEFKISINAYLSGLLYSPVRSLAQVIAFNEAHPVEERLKDFGQPDLIAAEKTNGIGTRERAAIRRLREISTNGLEKLMKERRLDAIVAPNSDASSVLAVGGYPGIAVPAGYDEQGVPFAICFGGLQGYEPRLIEIAYAFEQATKVRRPPTFKR